MQRPSAKRVAHARVAADTRLLQRYQVLYHQVQEQAHTLTDLLEGRTTVDVEGDGGKDVFRARQLGLFTCNVKGVDIIAKCEADAAPLIHYLEQGGVYGSLDFSRLLGYDEEQVAVYAELLKLQSELGLSPWGFRKASRPKMLGVPHHRQETDWSCGAAAVRAVLLHFGHDVPEPKLRDALGSTAKNGTEYTKMVDYLNGVTGVQAVAQTMTLDGLKKCVDTGCPVIVDLQAWGDKTDYSDEWDDGHYVVLDGYDATTLFFMDPASDDQIVTLPAADLNDRWHDVAGYGRLNHLGIVVKQNTLSRLAALASKRWGGFTFKIDRPKGFVKTWDQPDGSVKEYTYPVDYGYFVGHTGEDEEGLDAFVGSDPEGPIESFLKLKPDPDGGSKMVPDETKFMVGLTPAERKAVLKLYSEGELVDQKVYKDVYDLMDTLTDFRTAKKVASRFLRAAEGKYDGIDFKPPKSVAEQAEKGLKLREKASPSNRGGLTSQEAGKQGIGSGVQRAVNLKNRDNVTPETIGKMLGFFARHEKNKGIPPEHKDEPWNAKGYVAWLLWGGDAGRTWAKKVKEQMERADADSAKKVASRFLSAGVIEAPPAMVRDIGQWVMAVAAATYIDQIESASAGPSAFNPYQFIEDAFAALHQAIALGKLPAINKAAKEAAQIAATQFPMNPPPKIAGVDKDEASRRLTNWMAKIEAKIAEATGLISGRDDSRKQTLKPFLKSGIKPATSGDAVRVFPIDTTGWKYDGPALLKILQDRMTSAVQKEIEFEQRRQTPDPKYLADVQAELAKYLTGDFPMGKVTVKVILRAPDAKIGGSWNPSSRTLMVSVPQMRVLEAMGVKAVTADLYGFLRHELQHMSQWLIRMAVTESVNYIDSKRQTIPSAGMPPKKIMTPQWRQQGGESDTSHAMDDVEFFTRLSDSIDRAKRELANQNKAITQAYKRPPTVTEQQDTLLAIIGVKASPKVEVDRTFAIWKRMAQGKWKRAVKEFFKAFPILARAPNAPRVAAHGKNVALMKFLSDVSKRMGFGDNVYVVGGAVRNWVINQPIKDIDLLVDQIALGHTSEWVAQQIAKAIPVETNLTTNQYGVAILTVKGDWELGGHQMDGEVIEIAAARKESYGGETGKGYKPDTVEPATVQEDVVRREFTFNTLMWKLKDLAHGPEQAQIIDLTGCGLKDLQEGRMQCPADPDTVFSDDPSRLIRLVKFVTRYGFKLTPDTEAAAKRQAPKLSNVPHNAVSKLLSEVLVESKAKQAIALMNHIGLLDAIREMITKIPQFRDALNNWGNAQSVQYLFDLMDIGLVTKAKVGFLPPAQQERVRALASHMEADEAEHYLAVLKQPGKVLDMMAIANDLGLSGAGMKGLMDKAREILLERPDLIDSATEWESAVRKGMGKSASAKRVTAHYLHRKGA